MVDLKSLCSQLIVDDANIDGMVADTIDAENMDSSNITFGELSINDNTIQLKNNSDFNEIILNAELVKIDEI